MMYRTINNDSERYATIRAMDMLARQTNNEAALELWFQQGISDGDIDTEKEFMERYKVFTEVMSKPYVMGRDLIEAGLEPGAYFTEVLEYAHKLRLAGISKENQLKQAVSYARIMLRKQGVKSDN